MAEFIENEEEKSDDEEIDPVAIKHEKDCPHSRSAISFLGAEGRSESPFKREGLKIKIVDDDEDFSNHLAVPGASALRADDGAFSPDTGRRKRANSINGSSPNSKDVETCAWFNKIVGVFWNTWKDNDFF